MYWFTTWASPSSPCTGRAGTRWRPSRSWNGHLRTERTPSKYGKGEQGSVRRKSISTTYSTNDFGVRLAPETARYRDRRHSLATYAECRAINQTEFGESGLSVHHFCYKFAHTTYYSVPFFKILGGKSHLMGKIFASPKPRKMEFFHL